MNHSIAATIIRLHVAVLAVALAFFAAPAAAEDAAPPASETQDSQGTDTYMDTSGSTPEQMFVDDTGNGETGEGVGRVLDTADKIEDSRAIADDSGPVSNEQVSAPGNVTLDFKNADINNVLRIISLKSGVNIVTGKDVEGPITIRLVDVPWEKALEAVLKTYGYAYERDGNIIRVTTVDNLKTEELKTEVFPLNYAKAEEVQATLQEVLSERGNIRADSRTNVLIVTDVPTNIYKIQQIIERIDTATPQVLIEAKIIETTLGDTDKIGIKWNLQAELRGSVRPTTFPFQSSRHNEFDRYFPPGRAPVTSTSTTGGTTLAATSTSTDFQTIMHDGGLRPSWPVADKDDFAFGTLDFSQLQILLQILQTRSNAKVLSEPRITVLNNQEAKILVGEVLAVPIFERNETTGKMEVTGYEEKDLGIQLVVTPQINSENQIDVTLNPSITSLIGFDELTPDIKAPRFATREANTKVRVRNAETIVVGGLIKEDIIDTKNKLPILGDLPFLSYVFSHQERSITKTDLLFFITVTIIEEPDVRVSNAPVV